MAVPEYRRRVRNYAELNSINDPIQYRVALQNAITHECLKQDYLPIGSGIVAAACKT
jgi:hypothetical protein